MAILDRASRRVTVRIVYAGPPTAGKTASMEALAKLLMGDKNKDAVYSPGEAEGRTLFFDWLAYTGGIFNGFRVHCQIVSVPGQATLAQRRAHVLSGADGLIFVVDSTKANLTDAVSHYHEVTRVLEERDDGFVLGIVVQANKRDMPDPVPVDDIRLGLGIDAGTRVIETNAIGGTGVREAFVACVGLALNRAAALMEQKKLEEGTPEIATGEELLEQMEGLEASAAGDVNPVEEGLANVLDSADQQASVVEWRELRSFRGDPSEDAHAGEKQAGKVESPHSAMETVTPPRGQETIAIVKDAKSSDEAEHEIAAERSGRTNPPPIPDNRLAAGTVWPPLTGRAALEGITDQGGDPELQEDGSWTCTVGQWRLHTGLHSLVSNYGQALMRVLSTAREHRACEEVLSSQRCVALGEVGAGQWRLWQIVRTEPNLADGLARALEAEQSPEQLANDVVELATRLVEAVDRFTSGSLCLPVRLDTVGIRDDKVVYTGFYPMNGEDIRAPSDCTRMIREFFEEPIRTTVESTELDVARVLRKMQAMEGSVVRSDTIETLSALFIGH